MAGFEMRVWELVCYCLIFVFGFFGNLVICVVVLKSGPTFRDVPFNVYLMALAITDLILAVVCIPVYYMSTSKFHHPTGAMGTIFCKVVSGYLVPFWFGGASVYMLVVISFERYEAMRNPLTSRTRRTSKKTLMYIAATWVIGLFIQLPSIVGLRFASKGQQPSLGNHCVFTWEKNSRSTTVTCVYIAAFSLQYVVPAVIFIINFFRTQRCISKLDVTLKRSFGDARYQKAVMKNRRKSVRIVFIASAAFFLCWTPNNIMYFLFQYGDFDISWNSEIYQIGIILGFCNSCINPVLYAFQSKEFRGYCKNVFGRKFSKKRDVKAVMKRDLARSNSNLTTTSAKKSLVKFAV